MLMPRMNVQGRDKAAGRQLEKTAASYALVSRAARLPVNHGLFLVSATNLKQGVPTTSKSLKPAKHLIRRPRWAMGRPSAEQSTSPAKTTLGQVISIDIHKKQITHGVLRGLMTDMPGLGALTRFRHAALAWLKVV